MSGWWEGRRKEKRRQGGKTRRRLCSHQRGLGQQRRDPQPRALLVHRRPGARHQPQPPPDEPRGDARLRCLVGGRAFCVFLVVVVRRSLLRVQREARALAARTRCVSLSLSLSLSLPLSLPLLTGCLNSRRAPALWGRALRKLSSGSCRSSTHRAAWNTRALSVPSLAVSSACHCSSTFREACRQLYCGVFVCWLGE